MASVLKMGIPGLWFSQCSWVESYGFGFLGFSALPASVLYSKSENRLKPGGTGLQPTGPEAAKDLK